MPFDRRQTMRTLCVIIVLLGMRSSAPGALRGYPCVPYVLVDSNDSACVYAKIHWHDDSVSFAASTNHGQSFVAIQEGEVPPNAGEKLWSGEHRYARYGWAPTEIPEFDRRTDLLYSSDTGTTWQTTGLGSYIAEGTGRIKSRDRERYLAQYGRLAPERSRYWTATYFATVAILLTLFAAMSRKQGAAAVLLGAGKTLVATLVLFAFLHAFHWYLRTEIAWQFGSGYWFRNVPWVPSTKSAIIMNVAARPFWLVVFLVAVFPLLPLGVQCFEGCRRQSGGLATRQVPWTKLVATALWITILVWVLFVGELWA